MSIDRAAPLIFDPNSSTVYDYAELSGFAYVDKNVDKFRGSQDGTSNFTWHM